MSNETMPPSKLDTLSNAVQENTKATIAMSSAIRMIYLVPLALAAMGLAAWLLLQGKLTEWNFMTLALVCLSPFFGEGIGRIIERMPLVGKKVDAVQKAAAILLLAASVALVGCTLRFPIGEAGKYGTATVGYELPETAWKAAPAAKRNGDGKEILP